ncbi:MAG: hemerythrin domain-containing protein [Myxococcales bacterium]
MAITLPRSPSTTHRTGPADGPLLLLLGCHQRIRSFTALALRLLEAREAPLEQTRDAAVSVHRYFTEALPKHVEDEERTLAPRIVGWVPGAALAEMVGQHREIEEILAGLAELWQALGRDPRALPQLEDQLGPPTRRMAALWEPHLALEERELFPELSRLPESVRARIWLEMRVRRGRPEDASR